MAGGTKCDHIDEPQGEYMKAKIQKLDAQFKEDVPSRSQEGDIPKIFQNVVIHINGYTVPPADELRRLIYLHGGRYQQYYTKRSVTHIIATNLPNSKIRELRDELVVHPSWILDSIKAGILLPVDEYLLYHQRKVAQKVLNFKAKPSTTCTMAVPFSGEVPSKTTLSGVAQITKEVPSGDIASLSVNCMQPSRGELATCTLLASPSANPEERSNSKDSKKEADRFSKESDPFAEETTSLPQNSITVSEGQDFGKDEVEVQNCNDASLLDTIDNTVLKKPYKQSLTSMSRANDANFVSEFYNNSRLHYLSTWGAEFKKYTSDIIKSLAAKSWRKRGVGRVGTHGRVIMHIDMDSFFVSVTLRDQPHLRGKPIAVCHAGKGTSSTNEQQGTSPKKPPSFFNSMSEIASCSYEARASGVRNGMFLGSARKLCPDIHCVPYQFEEYRKVSQRLYDILVTYSHEIEAVSCDEAYIDVSEALEEDETPTELAEKIRADIKEATGCTASVGIAANVLLARMCTRVAKPDGCYHLSANDDINQFMGSQKVNDLPGVGWSLGHKLETLGVLTCLDLQKFSLQMLQKEFGPKTGLLLYQYCRGVDERALKIERERKSVSAEINYGIRFTAENEVVNFINELAKEVQKRLRALETKGRCITLKMKVRKAGAPSPRKFMGHGICDNIARSFTLPTVTDDAQIISKQSEVLLKQLNVIPEDVRGMGIQVSKLVDKNANADNKNSRSLFDFLKPQATLAAEVLPEATAIENRVEHEQVFGVLKSPENEQSKVPPLPRFSPQIAEGPRNTASRRSLGDLDESLYLPSPSQIDPSVLEALPEDIRKSIERSYAARNQKILRIHDGKEEQGEPGRRPQPQQKATTNRQSKTLPKPSRLQFEENPSNGTVQWISDLLPSPSQIDPEFLVALPDHVRQEIEQAYKGKDLKITRACIHVNAPANPHIEVLPTKNGMEMSTGTVHCGDFQNREGAEFDSPTNQACLGEAVTLPQVKQVIKQWTQAYEVPLEEDVEVLRNYLIQLVGTQNLEQLWRVLRFLDRTVDGRQGWQSACCAVLTQVQQTINTKYRTKLAVNSLKFAQCSVFSPENKMECTSCK